MLSQLRRRLFAPCLALGLAFAARVNAHDPFEITTDAHLDATGLNVHTTLSLDSAVRLCLAAAAPARRLARADFAGFRSQLERCARDYYVVSSGLQRLGVRSLALRLGPEDDLEVSVVHDRPTASPLVFEALGLKGLPEVGGIVLTVTGQRSFLGQKLLAPGDARLELSITPEGEALGTPSSSSSSLAPPVGSSAQTGAERSGPRAPRSFLFVLALLLSIAAFVVLRGRR